MTNSSGMNLNSGAAVGPQGEGRESPSIRGYPEYKDSGVEWLGEVPNHWLKVAIKFLATERKALFIDGDWIESKDLSDKGIRYITTGNVGQGHYKEQGSGHITEETFEKIKCTEVFPGDVLISRLNSPIGRACIVPDLDNRVVTSVDNVIFRPDSSFSKRFLVHLFSSFEYISNAENLARGATMQRISRGLLGNIRVVIPFERSEQNAIANYLDRETARIDKLITEKQNFIKLLKEKRQALISHVVTKGLDADVKMKESGIEWIGEVPEHWGLKPLKHIVLTRKGAAFKSNYFCDEGVSVIKASDIKNKTLRTSGIFLPSEFKKLFPKALIYHKEIILSTVGSLPEVKNSAVGQIGFVPKHLNGSLLNQNTVVFTALQQYIFPEYLLLLLQLPSYREHLDLNAHGTANQASLNIIDMLNFSFYLPTTTEQKLLVDTLSVSLKSLEELKNETLNSIDLLKEHRTALISAAVTGKIDVRDQIKECAA